jgi:hypothetical protein
MAPENGGNQKLSWPPSFLPFDSCPRPEHQNPSQMSSPSQLSTTPIAKTNWTTREHSQASSSTPNKSSTAQRQREEDGGDVEEEEGGDGERTSEVSKTTPIIPESELRDDDMRTESVSADEDNRQRVLNEPSPVFDGSFMKKRYQLEELEDRKFEKGHPCVSQSTNSADKHVL